MNATIGFQALAKELGEKPQSLMRMLSPTGNLRLSNFAKLVDYLCDYEGIPLFEGAN